MTFNKKPWNEWGKKKRNLTYNDKCLIWDAPNSIPSDMINKFITSPINASD